MSAVNDRMDMIDGACSLGNLVQYMNIYLINEQHGLQ